jgi:hypothetical protein
MLQRAVNLLPNISREVAVFRCLSRAELQASRKQLTAGLFHLTDRPVPLFRPSLHFPPTAACHSVFSFSALSYFFLTFFFADSCPRLLFAFVHLRLPLSLNNPCDESLPRDFEMYSISENTKGNTDSELLRTWR